ncbi:MAG: uracil-DNA glycosylase [Chloroflexi bacterium]|jgi:uracil-DNA glycosylase|nr:uracil-DNA glycosylase [Chloroflexota bacterium]MBT3670223.1 uracil-DNA glycosylase [Chloroflexota bacterium]MBT4003753.1 uracil-DNA glycosylase [Chloroflexota bacterium]MBT4306103.1 uracil-DNA glycosylase [Chloroflexota bacterium]MBT4534483.1 uracil-DNA glycosylase [Chloroflexota bacterium]
MPDIAPLELIQQISREVKVCSLCELQHSRLKAVPGYGQSSAEIIFVGNAPDFFEDKEGLPMVGTAGLIFDELLEKENLHRKQVYTTNMVKCRPPNDRHPEPLELATCLVYLNRQLEAIQPKVVVTLGQSSLQRLMPNAKLEEMHGKFVEINGQLYIPFYHPRSVVNNPSLRPVLEEDFKKLITWITDPKNDTEGFNKISVKEEDKQEQLSLF